jgi:drug/metabolite transporter (DMT)-like permease
MSTENRSTALFLLIILALIWGTSFILMKKGLIVFSAGEVAAVRVVAASVFLLPFALRSLREVQSTHYAKLFFSGMMGVFFPAFLFATAQTKMESGITGVLNSLTPICTLIIGALVFNQHFKTRSLVGILVGLAGTVLLVISRAEGKIGGLNFFAGYIILGCLCYGVNVNFLKFKLNDLKPLTLTSIALMLIGPLALLYLLLFTTFTGKLQSMEGAWTALAFIVLLGVMSTSIATILFNKLIKISTPLFASSSTYIIPIVAVLWGLLDGERFGVGHLAGMIAIIGGVYLANKK